METPKGIEDELPDSPVKNEAKLQKHTTGGIPRWSPTLVLVARFSAYVWQSGRSTQLSPANAWEARDPTRAEASAARDPGSRVAAPDSWFQEYISHSSVPRAKPSPPQWQHPSPVLILAPGTRWSATVDWFKILGFG